MRDAYLRFFDALKMSPAEFFKFGLDEIIHVPMEAAHEEWTRLKSRIENGEAVTIRGFGKNGSNSHLFVNLYASVLDHTNIRIDGTNNAAPTKLLQNLTGYSKTPKRNRETVRNYQVSHVFGRTKNPFAFTAPWNIVYLPKIVDPFTGHEAPGDLSKQFQTQFQRRIASIFGDMIDDFNCILTEKGFLDRVQAHLAKLDDSAEDKQKISSAIKEELQPISIIEE